MLFVLLIIGLGVGLYFYLSRPPTLADIADDLRKAGYELVHPARAGLMPGDIVSKSGEYNVSVDFQSPIVASGSQPIQFSIRKNRVRLESDASASEKNVDGFILEALLKSKRKVTINFGNTTVKSVTGQELAGSPMSLNYKAAIGNLGDRVVVKEVVISTGMVYKVEVDDAAKVKTQIEQSLAAQGATQPAVKVGSALRESEHNVLEWTTDKPMVIGYKKFTNPSEILVAARYDVTISNIKVLAIGTASARKVATAHCTLRWPSKLAIKSILNFRRST